MLILDDSIIFPDGSFDGDYAKVDIAIEQSLQILNEIPEFLICFDKYQEREQNRGCNRILFTLIELEFRLAEKNSYELTAKNKKDLKEINELICLNWVDCRKIAEITLPIFES